ncbi:hypothetical protein ACWEPM_33910 [Streptomyces sp. NPDC004244]
MEAVLVPHLQQNHPGGDPVPVPARHRVGQHQVLEQRAQRVGGPAPYELLLAGGEFILAALAEPLGGAAYSFRREQSSPLPDGLVARIDR